MFRSSSWYFLYKTKFTYCLKKGILLFFSSTRNVHSQNQVGRDVADSDQEG